MPDLNKTAKKSRINADGELIDVLQGEIHTLKSMMDQKDNLLEKMGQVFQEKDSIISKLKTKLHNTTFDKSLHSNSKHDLTTKAIFKPSPERRNSGSGSDRSLRSLAYLMHKTQKDKMHQTHIEAKKEMGPNLNDSETDGKLSHSHSETLSGSSTTSIVDKCYGKSWKQSYQQYQGDSEGEENFERDVGQSD